ncbi:aldolase/citrate lyase family protein [Rhodospirillales bacterium]|nr:aldolase/citrate lyase family protein [Rhodospirillales bacterium]
MSKIPRLNGIIGALTNSGVAFSTFASMDVQTGITIATSKFDGVVYEGEHNPWDIVGLRDAMQFMLNRREIAASGLIAPTVTPLARIPVNGVEQGQWHAKQALDTGVYGVVWPHISTVEEAYNAVAACRYPRLNSVPLYEPRGIRGDGPVRAARYWGLTQQEYYSKADVWPLDPNGEILVVIQIEDTTGIRNLSDMLENVPGIGAILIGEGDLGQELGFPRQYDHPALLEAIAEIVSICKKHDVVVGHAHAGTGNMQRLLDEGFRLMMTASGHSYAGLERGLELTNREK